MKHLALTALLLVSFSPLGSSAGILPVDNIVKTPVEEILKRALEARERGDYEGALTLLREAQKIDPTNLDVGFYIGLTLYNLSQFDAAETTLRDVLKENATYVDAKLILGRILLIKGSFPESETLLREVLAQTPGYIDAYDALASTLLAQKKNAEAIEVLDQGLQQKPGATELLVKKAKILFLSRRYSEARDVAYELTGAIDIRARYEGHVLLAKVSFEEDPMHIGAVTPELEEAIELIPSENEAHLVLADVYISLWKFKKAREVLAEAIDVVKDRKAIELKLAQLESVEKDTLKYSVNAAYAQWGFKDNRAPWKEFYLDAVWRIDPYKTLVFGYESFTRGGMDDETLRIEYVQKLNKWIYLYAKATYTIDPDFREKYSAKIGSNFVINPLSIGATVIVAEAERRDYDTGKIYFLTGGIDQNVGEKLTLSARVFRVLTPAQDSTLWSLKTNWRLTPKASVNVNYGTVTEAVNGQLVRGTSRGAGVEYRVSDRVSVTGNYQRNRNDAYDARQVTVGLKVKLGPRGSGSR